MRSNFHVAIVLFVFGIALRLRSALMYDPLQDELYALRNNLHFSIKDFLIYPIDTTHPPLWYVLMDPIVTMTDNIRVLRMMQIAIWGALMWTAYSIFPQKYRLTKHLLFAFFMLQPFIVHLTFQFRMYALVFGLGAVFFALFVALVQAAPEGKKRWLLSVALSISGALGLFTNYSFFWLYLVVIITTGSALVIWRQQQSALFQKVALPLAASAILLSWYTPTFIRNFFDTASRHSWTPTVSPDQIIYLIKNLLGLPNALPHVWTTVVVVGVLCLLIGYTAKSFTNDPRGDSGLAFLPGATLAAFDVFLVICVLYPRSFFYARVVFLLIIPLAFILADGVTLIPNLLARTAVVWVLVIIVVFSSLQYSSNSAGTWNPTTNPMRLIVQHIKAAGDHACIFPIPVWDKIQLEYFLRQSPNEPVIRVLDITNNNDAALVQQCPAIYITRDNSPGTESGVYDEVSARIAQKISRCSDKLFVSRSGQYTLWKCFY